MTPTFVTAKPWAGGLQHTQYGAAETYHRAADWLAGCPNVADWGGGRGFFSTLLPASAKYTLVDGTMQSTPQVLADLSTYKTPSAGILLRHVLELNTNWRDILRHALMAFQSRMVVVTFTGPADVSGLLKFKSGWPIHGFNLDDLRREMGHYLVRDEAVATTHPEHVFYLEKGR